MQKEVHHWTGNHYKDAPQSSIQISVKTYRFKIKFFKVVLNKVSQIGLEIKQAVFGILFLTLLSISRFLPLQISKFEENS